MDQYDKNSKSSDIACNEEYTPPFPPSMVVYTSDLELLDDLPPEQAGAVILAVIKKFQTGKSQADKFSDSGAKIVYRVISKGVERNKNAYYNKCRKNRSNRLKREKEKAEKERGTNEFEGNPFEEY